MNSDVHPAQALDPVSRMAAVGGVVGPLTFVVLVLTAGAMYDGYSHISQAVSELGETARSGHFSRTSTSCCSA